MNNISKIHQEFSRSLKNPRVLTNPEEFLGPNYEAVLNFWLFLDDLTKDQFKAIEGRYWDFCNNQPSEWCKASDEAIEASYETIGDKFANNASYGNIAFYATKELIGMHKFFGQNKPLTFFPMFLEVL